MNSTVITMFFANALMIIAKAYLGGSLSPLIIQFFKKVVFVKVKAFVWKWVIALCVTLGVGYIVAWSQGVFQNWQATIADYGLLTIALAATWKFCQDFWKQTFEPLFSSMKQSGLKN